jgi:hypothetical protein
MTRILIAATALLASPAGAHDGLHLHPHGIEQVWVVFAAAGVAAGYAAWLRLRK